MEDDRHILAVLSCQDRARQGGGEGGRRGGRGGGGGEVVLSPNSLTGTRRAFDFLNIVFISLFQTET